MGRNIVETIVGGLVLVVAVGFLVQLLRAAEVSTSQDGYQLEVRFYRAGGLQSGADVRISGVKVGTIIAHALDPVRFEAVMTLAIDSDIRLPVDTEAIVTGDGLLGGKYLRLMPGHEDEFLADGSTLTRVRDFKSIEDQVSEIIFLATSP